MKNRIKAAIAAAGIAALAAVCFVQTNNQTEDLFEKNVEALARGESGILGPMCSKTATRGDYYMKLCSSCRGSYGHYAMDVVAYCPK
ncbi:MAG: hypothetical protein IJ652_02195 [Bacteroidales bacterium]|nr:hypothetical protein [Bacteroidales bacterium]